MLQCTPFDTFSNLGDKLSLNIIFEEEVRFKELAVETLQISTTRGSTSLTKLLVAFDRALVIISLDGVFAVEEGVGREDVQKLMLATRLVILEKQNAHMVTMPTHTADNSYSVILSASCIYF